MEDRRDGRTKTAAVGKDNGQALELHYRMLGGKLYLFSASRFLAAAAIVFGAFFAKVVVGVHDLNVGGLLIVACCLAVYNTVAFILLRPHRNVVTTAKTRPFLIAVMDASILLDYLFLTIALWLVGGAQSPFKAFYIIHVIISAVLLPRSKVWIHAMAGFLMFSTLVLLEWTRWIPVLAPHGAVGGYEPISGRYVITVLFVQALLLTLTIVFLTSLTQMLRRGEAQMTRAREELVRFSEMQRNFLRIAMHDAKSPISAAVTFIYNLRAELYGPLSQPQSEAAEKALRRLKDVLSLFRDFEVLSALDSIDVTKQGEKVDFNELLRRVVDDHQDLAALRHHTLELEQADDLPPVHGIETLLRESVVNLITNACKYTPEGGRIRVRSRRMGDGVRVEVDDNGPGITPEEQNRLFQEFSRLKPKGKMRDAGGSGLGLSNVKRIVELHGGRVRLESDVNQGSCFIIELPSVQASVVPPPSRGDG